MKNRKTVCDLDEALDYQNPSIIRDFRRCYAINAKEAALLFEDVKRWLWLCAKVHSVGSKNLNAEIGPSLRLLDEMWHTFILHTTAYRDYCHSKFGFFIDHQPEPSPRRQRVRATTHEELARTEQKLRLQYEFIYDHLGKEVLERWYGEWSSSVTTGYLRRMLVKHSN